MRFRVDEMPLIPTDCPFFELTSPHPSGLRTHYCMLSGNKCTYFNEDNYSSEHQMCCDHLIDEAAEEWFRNQR